MNPVSADARRIYCWCPDPTYFILRLLVRRLRSGRHPHADGRRPRRRPVQRGILHGDVLTDMCIAVLFYPLALVQHEKELRAPDDFYDASEKESEEKEA
jgi:hypothetical protein